MKKNLILILFAALFLLALPMSVEAEVIASGSCGTNTTYTLDDTGLLTISGSGQMTESPWRNDEYKDAVRKVEIKDGVTSIVSSAFSKCFNIQSITIPDTVQSIGQFAFTSCLSLSEIILPGGLSYIESKVFWCSSGLKSITIPDSVTGIGEDAFYGCDNLQAFIVADGNTAYKSLDGVLYDKEMKTLIACPSEWKGALIIPDGVNTIEERAVSHCSNITEIILPDTLTTIKANAFYDCGITSIKIPDSVTVIEREAFYCCEKLTEVIIPESVESIGYMAFGFCEALKSVTIQEGVTGIADSAFRGCSNLRSITIPDSIKSIGKLAFYGCSRLSDVIIMDEVDSIAEEAFSGFHGTIVFKGGAPEDIDPEAFQSGYITIVYPHDEPGWEELTGNSYGAHWICWQKDNSEQIIISPKEATETLIQEMSDNEGGHDYQSGITSQQVNSYLVAEKDGAFTRVEYTGEKVVIEQYSPNMEIVWKKTLAPELPLWGGFYAGEDYNFFVYGQKNGEEDDDKEVVRVVRYDKNWNRIDAAGVPGEGITVPFDGGTLDMVQSGDYLYIHTSRKMYTYSDGIRHQSNLTYQLYIPEMDFVYSSDYSPVYVSHSFNQIVYVDEGDLITVDHGDGYPRGIVMKRMENDAERPGFSNVVAPDKIQKNDGISEVVLLTFGGYDGLNYTGATLGDFAASDTRYIVTGKSIDQEKFGSTNRDNIYVVTASREDFSDASVLFRWQTEYPEDNEVVLANPYLVRITGTRLLLIWAEDMDFSENSSLLHYVFLDENGGEASEVYTAPGRLSDVAPVLSDNRITWYVTTGDEGLFYALDLNDTTVQTVPWLRVAGWHTDGAGSWMYGDANGYAVTGKKTIDGKTYYFDKKGVLQFGWAEDSGKRYYLNEEGIMQTGWINVDSQKYYLDSDGVMQTGWQDIDGQRYYFGSDGIMRTGWAEIDGRRYYLGNNGVMQTGMIYIDGQYYHMDADGVMQTGWVEDNNQQYYFDSNGVRHSGWAEIDGHQYYLDKGKKTVGWKRVDDNKYYFDSDGVMQTGWLILGERKYYLDNNGVMQTGWVEKDGRRYYMDSSGVMQTGWVKDGDQQYYMDSEGIMQTGCWIEETRADGFYWGYNGLEIIEVTDRYYLNSSGVMQTGWATVDGKRCYFGSDGILQENPAEPDPAGEVDKVTAFVKRCYSLILGREADEGGLNNWVNQLKAKVMNASEIISGFMNSQEYISQNNTNDETVEVLYNTMLDRGSDPEGKANWVGKLNESGSSNTIINGFCGSQEFLAICEDYGIIAGSVGGGGETGLRGFVERCYTQALSRQSDEGGFEYWCSIMERKEQTPQEVAAGFVYSQEMNAAGKIIEDPDALLDSLYRLYLGREADVDGKEYWKQRIADGLTLDELNYGFAYSAEFNGIVESYGLGE